MAEIWKINDSAREMTDKFNTVVDELNRVSRMAVSINAGYLTAVPSEFVIGGSPQMMEVPVDEL